MRVWHSKSVALRASKILDAFGPRRSDNCVDLAR